MQKPQVQAIIQKAENGYMLVGPDGRTYIANNEKEMFGHVSNFFGVAAQGSTTVTVDSADTQTEQVNVAEDGTQKVTAENREEVIARLESLNVEVPKGTRNTTLEKMLVEAEAKVAKVESVETSDDTVEAPAEAEEEKAPACLVCDGSGEIAEGVECPACSKEEITVDIVKTIGNSLIAKKPEAERKVCFTAVSTAIKKNFSVNKLTEVPADKMVEAAKAIIEALSSQDQDDDEW